MRGGRGKQGRKRLPEGWKLAGGFLALWAYQAVYCLKPLQSLDELWIFNMGLQMSAGGKTYQDFSSVVTPVSFLVSGVVLHVFGQELLALRILGALVSGEICFVFYLILRQNVEDRPVAIIFTAMFSIGYGRKFTYDYNWLLLLEALVLLYLMLRREKSVRWSSRESLAVGILGGTAFLTKQSTGLCVMAAVLAVCCVEDRKRNDLCFIKVLWGSILPVGGCLLWLKSMGCLEAFWDYCFRGVVSFSRQNKRGLGEYLQAGGIFSFLELGFVAAVTVLAFFRAYKYPAERRRLLLMVCCGFSASVVVYPIMDFTHTQVALVPFLLIGAEILAAKCRKVGAGEGVAAVLLVAAMALGVPTLALKAENMCWSRLDHFRHIRVDCGLEEAVKNVAAYTDGKESYILDASAAVYHIPMGIYYKDYDMFNYGNLGKGSPLELVEALRERESMIFLLKEEYALNWQTPVEAIQYIRRHCEKLGEVESFEVYSFSSSEIQDCNSR